LALPSTESGRCPAELQHLRRQRAPLRGPGTPAWQRRKAVAATLRRLPPASRTTTGPCAAARPRVRRHPVPDDASTTGIDRRAPAYRGSWTFRLRVALSCRATGVALCRPVVPRAPRPSTTPAGPTPGPRRASACMCADVAGSHRGYC